MITIRADYDHDGLIDEDLKAEGVRRPFGIVLPVPDIAERLSDGRGDVQLLGGMRPIDVGTIKVQVSEPPSKDCQFEFRVDPISQGRVHLLHRCNETWVHLGSDGVWHVPCSAKHEMTLALVAHSFDQVGNQQKWSGEFTFSAAMVTEGSKAGSAATAHFVVAPFLMASSLDPVDEVLVVKNRRTMHFVDALRETLSHTGVRLSLIEVQNGTESDVWVQDSVEIGRVCVPGIEGAKQAVAVLTGIRSKHEGIKCEPLDRHMKQYFQGRAAILVEAAGPREGTKWIDWYGNLEVSPPVTARNGQEFHFGRIITGVQDKLGMHPDILAFLEAQKLQVPPLVIDTSWLLIGHADEVVNFCPAPDRQGFRILFPSPSLALTILEDIAGRGLGGEKVFADHSGETTVEELLQNAAMNEENERIMRILNETRIQLCEGLGVDSGDFVEIPVLFSDGVAVIPNCVNGLICNGHAILPDPLGPCVNGKDAFKTAIRTPLENIGVKVHFIDIWEPYHTHCGEVHCGTNAVRRLQKAAWWDFVC